MRVDASKANLRPISRNIISPQLDYPTGRAAITNLKTKKVPLSGRGLRVVKKARTHHTGFLGMAGKGEGAEVNSYILSSDVSLERGSVNGAELHAWNLERSS